MNDGRVLSVDGQSSARDRAAVLGRERRAFGGLRVVAAFFGWVTAIGMSVMLTVLVVVALVAVGLTTDTAKGATDSAAANPARVSVVGAAVLALILWGSFFCGGYVAGRMARFDGRRQGVGVWLWTIAVPSALAVAAIVAGGSFRAVVLSNSVDRPTAVMIVALLALTLLGAVLGGRAGERFHRAVDAVGLPGGTAATTAGALRADPGSIDVPGAPAPPRDHLTPKVHP